MKPAKPGTNVLTTRGKCTGGGELTRRECSHTDQGPNHPNELNSCGSIHLSRISSFIVTGSTLCYKRLLLVPTARNPPNGAVQHSGSLHPAFAGERAAGIRSSLAPFRRIGGMAINECGDGESREARQPIVDQSACARASRLSRASPKSMRVFSLTNSGLSTPA